MAVPVRCTVWDRVESAAADWYAPDEIAGTRVLSARTECVLLEYVERLYDAALLDYGAGFRLPGDRAPVTM